MGEGGGSYFRGFCVDVINVCSLMKNNMSGRKRELSQTNVIYEFTCPQNECFHHPTINNRYRGFTTCTVSKRLSFHLQTGAILKHSIESHGRKIDRKTAEQCLKIRYKENNQERLEILEAIMIMVEKPEINKQDTGKKRILKLFQWQLSPPPVSRWRCFQ